MRVRITLHSADGELLIIDGLMIDCPRIPSHGDHILQGEQWVRVGRVLHDYRAEYLQVSMLA